MERLSTCREKRWKWNRNLVFPAPSALFRPGTPFQRTGNSWKSLLPEPLPMTTRYRHAFYQSVAGSSRPRKNSLRPHSCSRAWQASSPRSFTSLSPVSGKAVFQAIQTIPLTDMERKEFLPSPGNSPREPGLPTVTEHSRRALEQVFPCVL